MGRIDLRAERAYDLLLRNMETPYDFSGLCKLIGEHGGHTTRSVINRVRALAFLDGYCLTHACAANGFTYMLTAYAEPVIDGSLQLHRVEIGVGKVRARDQRFIHEHRHTLDPLDAQLVAVLESVTGKMNEALDEFTAGVVEARRIKRTTKNGI